MKPRNGKGRKGSLEILAPALA